MGAWHKGPGYLVRGQDGAHGQPVGQRFGNRNDIGLHIACLEGPEAPCAAHAGLHLVAAEKDAFLAAEGLYSLHIVRRKRDNAALALHNFKKDCAGFLAHGFFQGIQIAGRHLLKAACYRSKAVHEPGTAGGCQGAQGTAVEAA